MRVLLLEDSSLDADLIRSWLDSGDFKCHLSCVQTRADFLDALRQHEFDLILSDYSLPGFDGPEALALAQQIRPDWPFIFVSGHLGEDLAIETLKLGATDYVLKGRLERLLPSIERAMREATQRRERKRIETMLQILSQASLVLSSLDYSTTLSHVARLAVPHFADYCLVDVVAEDESIERVAVAHADPKKEELAQQLLEFAPFKESQHPVRQVLLSQKSLLLSHMPANVIENNARNEKHLEVLQQLGAESCMMVPLLAEGQALGVMTFILSSSQRRYEPLDLSLAEDLARRCAMAVENARLHRKTLDALRARDEFLAVLSHELRSPLTSILGWVQLLRDNELDEATRRHGLDVIERNSRAQVKLIQDLLEISRIITGRLRLELAPLRPSQIIQNVLDLMTPTASAKKIEISFENQANEAQIWGDEPRLQQVFWNLVSNALKFTPSGGQIEIDLREAAGSVNVQVRDSGEGIVPEFLPFVFDRFRQANSTSTRQHGGLGLGLAIVRQITEMHGGNVTVQSEGAGRGATFTVSLPLRPSETAMGSRIAENLTSQTGELTTESATSRLKGCQVLIVEDEDDARELLAAVVRRAGAQVTAVKSADLAMQELQLQIPNVLVSDIAMPSEDGYSLLGRVRAWENEHQRHIPAIALTAYASDQDHRRALDAGFQKHLSKPVEPAQLVAAISDLIGAATL